MPERSLNEKGIHEGKSQQAYTEASRLHESLLNAAGLAIVTTDTNGVIISINRPAISLFGYLPEELMGKSAAIILHDADPVTKRVEEYPRQARESVEPLIQAIFQKAGHRKLPERSEWTFVRKDSSCFHGSLTVVSIRNDADEVIGFAEIITDLSTQLSLMEQVTISNEKFRLLAENIPGVIYLCHNDPHYTLIYVNDAILTLTGYPKEEFYAGRMTYAGLIHPDDIQMIIETVNRAIKDRTSYHLHYRLRHISGRYRWVHESGIGLFEADKLMMLEGYIQDITVLKETEEKLKKIADENLRFFNNPVNLNAVADFEGNLVRISPSWKKILGWTDEQLQSQPILNLVHPDDLEAAKEELRFLSTTTQVHTFENRLRREDGSYRWLLWGLAADLEAKLIYASAIDITERKKSEETILNSKSSLEGITLRLQDQNRKLDEFAHIISHNLRAPVNNIQALINLLDEKSDIIDYQLIFEKLKKVSKNLSETMNELMDTLKAKTQPDVELTEIRFKEVLDKVVQSLEGELILAQASVTFDFNDAPTIRYSKTYLESIFQNLLTNAVKYKSSTRKPAVHFRSFFSGNHLELEVADNGQGIDMEKFGDKLFGLHKTFHRHAEARGVGLFLVKTQIEALGGSIRAMSEVDKGTTFTIRFN